MPGDFPKWYRQDNANITWIVNHASSENPLKLENSVFRSHTSLMPRSGRTKRDDKFALWAFRLVTWASLFPSSCLLHSHFFFFSAFAFLERFNLRSSIHLSQYAISRAQQTADT